MLSTSEIRQFITDDSTSERKIQAKVGQRYYEAEHDILQYRMFFYNSDGKLTEDKVRANNRICHPFFTELSDQLSAHILSFKENPIRAKENVEGLQDHLDTYFDESFWSVIGELISGAYNKGFDYIYAYQSKENRLAFQYADGLGVIEVRAKDTDDGCEYIIFWYIDRIDKGKKPIKRIQVWSEKETYYYVQSGASGKILLDDSVELNPRPHIVYTDEETGKRMGYPLGYIPFFRLDNNRKQFSGLKPIKGLIDDYDLMQCGLSNNLADFDTPLHVVKGYNGNNLDELQQNLKTKKIVGVDDEGGIDVKTIDVPYQARQAKAADDERNIYKFGMGLNTYGLKDMAATTNLGIQSAYTLLNMKADNLQQKQLNPLLKEVVKIVLAEINSQNGKDYQLSDVFFDFKRNPIVNETENIANEKIKAEIKQLEVNTILNVAANVGDEQTLKAICGVMDWDFDELKDQIEKLQEEQNNATAKATLNNVVPEPTPEPPNPDGEE